MVLEIRLAKQEEMADFRRVASTALLDKETSFEAMKPEWTLCAFEDNKMATTFGAWPLKMRFNGKEAQVSGVTCVGTLPFYRRHGHLRKIMTQHFQNLHETGKQSLAILFASMAAIYQRFGYGIVSHQIGYNVEPRYIEYSYSGKYEGTLRELDDSETDFQIMAELYRKFRPDGTGYLKRSRSTWAHGVLAPVTVANQRLIKATYENGGVPQGYVIYVTMPQPGFPSANRLFIRDLVWLNIDAYRTIWAHFANMDLFSNILWMRAPSDDPLPYMLLEPRRLQATLRDGLLARVIDVDKAFTSRKYQEESELIFEVVNDELCPWNQGRWLLETSPEGSNIRCTKKSPQLVVPISTLAMLLFGHISATEAAKMGRLEVVKEKALYEYDRVMRTLYAPACADGF
jgi:predicted acetyltransferase